MIPQMRTGLLDEPVDATPQSVDFVKKLMAMALSLVTKAGESAAVYAKHAGRRTVLPADVNRGLMYQSKIFMSEVTDEEIEESYGTVSEAFEDTTDSNSDDDDDDDEDEEEEEWTASSCHCTSCSGMNEAADTWDTYEPEDEVLKYLKDRTDEIISKKL